MTKYFFGSQEYDLLEHPIKIFTKLYGANIHLLKLISLRFESFYSKILSEKQIEFLFIFLKNFISESCDFSKLYLYNILLLDYTNSYHTFRHLFNLPVNGQRTWGGGKSIKITKSQLFNHKLKKYTYIAKIPYILFLSEIVNRLWKYQWFHEWSHSHEYIDDLPWYVKKKKNLLVYHLLLIEESNLFLNIHIKEKKKNIIEKKK